MFLFDGALLGPRERAQFSYLAKLLRTPRLTLLTDMPLRRVADPFLGLSSPSAHKIKESRTKLRGPVSSVGSWPYIFVHPFLLYGEQLQNHATVHNTPKLGGSSSNVVVEKAAVSL
jgi:hypothetical protein